MSENQEQEQFEMKLAAAGELLQKLAAERGLNLNDFTEEESIDLLSTLMGEGGGDGGGGAPAEVAPKVASQAAPTGGYRDPVPAEKVAYNVALAEVMKVAAANNFDLNTASADELHAAVEDMQGIMADPTYGQKQAALQEKVAEADMLGRVMAHSYVDELGKLASANAAPAGDSKTEKKAALVRDIRNKTAGEMPPWLHGKGEKKDDDKDGKKDKDEEEKKAAFAKQASLRAEEVLITSGINPATGAKFASEAEAVEAGAQHILKTKGYVG